MKREEIGGVLLLSLTALIWGTAFVAQKSGLEYLGPFTFNGVRSIIGFLALMPCIFLIDLISGRRPSIWGDAKGREGRRALIMGGVACGIILGIASSLQQIGIKYTSIGKAGFITTLYIIIVPLLGVFFKRKVGWLLWFCSFLAVVGMYLLCFRGGGSLNPGDALVFLCSIVFSLHILTVDHFAPKADGVRLSCLQFLVAGIIALLCALFFEDIVWKALLNAKIPLLYAGLFSCGIAYTLQIVGQKHVHPVVASLLMSLESVFAALSGWAILHEKLCPTEILGCIVIFMAVIIAQLPQGREKNARD